MATLVLLTCALQAWGAIAGGLLGIPHEFRREVEASATVPAACSSLEYFISVCNSYYPDLGSQPLTVQAECLCYDGTTWLPDIFDGIASTCADWAKTADPEDYTTVDSWAGLCTYAGDFINSTPTPTPSPTPTIRTTTPPPMTSTELATSPTITAAPTTSVDIINNAGCSFALSAVEFCSSVGSTLSADEVYCLCYSSTAWDPDPFDNAIATCANFVKTADPTDYSVWTSLEGFCANAGPLTTSQTPNSSPTMTPRPTAVTQASSTHTNGVPSNPELNVGNLGAIGSLLGFFGFVMALL